MAGKNHTGIPIKNNARSAHSSNRDIVPPETEHNIECRNLERNKQGFIEIEVVARHEAEGLVDPFVGKADEPAADGHENGHFGDTVVDKTQQTAVEEVCKEHTSWTTMMECAAYGYEESSTDTATDSDELNLSVAETTLKAVGIVVNFALLDVAVVDRVVCLVLV